jgi:hypothetical protein
MMVLDEQPEQINFSVSYETELTDVWEEKQDPIIWSKKDDKLSRKNQNRNKEIQKIRDPFLSETKERKHFYENKGNYNYKSREHFEQFIEILEAAGLIKEPIDTQERNQYNTDGFYHKIPIPREKISAKLYIEKLDPNEIESKYSLGLGGMEVNL